MASKRDNRRKPRPSFIDPARLYTLEGFRHASGISGTRMREGRLRAVELIYLQVGRRKFIRGQVAIEYIERLAKLSSDGDG